MIYSLLASGCLLITIGVIALYKAQTGSGRGGFAGSALVAAGLLAAFAGYTGRAELFGGIGGWLLFGLIVVAAGIQVRHTLNRRAARNRTAAERLRLHVNRAEQMRDEQLADGASDLP